MSGKQTAAELAYLTRALKAPTLRDAVPRLAERVLRQGSCRISGFESDHTVGVWLTRE